MESDCRDRALDVSDYSDVDILDDEDDIVSSLQQAQEAPIARKRSLQRTSAEKSEAASKKSKVAHGGSTRLVKVKPEKRLSEFPNEMLTVSNKQLYCEACHTVLSLKKSIVEDHLKSDRHFRGKEERQAQLLRQEKVLESWEKYQKRHASVLSGTGLTPAVDPTHSLARIQAVSVLLKAGIPLAKMSYLRPLLEEGSVPLTDVSHLRSYIPFIHEMEVATLKSELQNHPPLTVIFDGSTYQGEALAVLIRYINDDFTIVQRLVRVHILAKSINGQELAREIITTLSTEMQIPASAVVGAVRDGASVNGAALRILKDVMYPDLISIICVSHTLDNVGRHMETPLLTTFLQWWVGLFSHSPATKLVWKTQTGHAIKGYSRTRWWSWWEVLVQLEEHFQAVLPFLTGLEYSPTLRNHLKEVLEDDQQRTTLRLQLAVTLDAGRPFVTSTYSLEGDGEAVVTAYRTLQEVSTAAAVQNYPKTNAVALEMANGTQVEADGLVATAKACVAPAIRYFRERMNKNGTEMFEVVRLLKALRLFCPEQAATLRPTAEDIADLRVLPALNDDALITQLQEELPVYLTAAGDVVIDANTTRLQWWKRQTRLPCWQKAAKIAFCLLPSSAPAERVFSLMSAAIGDQQHSFLEDHIQTMLMLQYNRN